MTTSRKHLFILIFKMFFLTSILLLFFYSIMPQNKHMYNAALIDKVDRLETINEPKIVLIGNSNVAFGFESRMVEEKFNMPVVNMGMHAQLGNAFHEEMAKINVTPGDIYIVCHTDYGDDDTIEDGVLAWSTIENHAELWKLLRVKDVPLMLRAYPTYLNRSLETWSRNKGNRYYRESPYSRESFNIYGDVEFDRECKWKQDGHVDEITPNISDVCISRLNSLDAYLEKRGAELVIAGYPIMVDGEPSEGFREQMEQFEQKLEERCECNVISDYQDYFYDRSYFYDTVYHLTNEGTVMRTEEWISDLESYFSK